ncbi:MAG: hypothetical protein ACTHKH_20800 [Trinickia sp.]|jgi:hypothetical protein
MLHKITSGFLAIGVALTLAGCGGGGSGGSTGAGSSAAAASPTLAAATQVVDGTTLGTEYWPSGPTSGGGTGQTLNTLKCADAGNSYTYTHLSIYVNGQQLAIPANVGIVQPTLAAPKGCVYPLNTVDESGKIHMDEANTTYTLGQFFAIWGQPLTTTNVAGIAASSYTVYVNKDGALSKYSGCACDLVLPPKGEITIVIGTPLAQIPTYTWTDPPAFNLNPIKLTAGGTVGTTPYWPDGNTSAGGNGANVDALTCSANMTQSYQVNAHLAIIYNGQWLQTPKNIGVTSGCTYEMSTSDQTGIIHIGSPAVKNYTLGAFFDIWGEPLTATNVAGLSGNVVAYINDNGESRRYMGDLRAIQLISHRDITLQIGTPAVTSLATYTWYLAQ